MPFHGRYTDITGWEAFPKKVPETQIVRHCSYENLLRLDWVHFYVNQIHFQIHF